MPVVFFDEAAAYDHEPGCVVRSRCYRARGLDVGVSIVDRLATTRRMAFLFARPWRRPNAAQGLRCAVCFQHRPSNANTSERMDREELDSPLKPPRMHLVAARPSRIRAGLILAVASVRNGNGTTAKLRANVVPHVPTDKPREDQGRSFLNPFKSTTATSRRISRRTSR